MKLRLSALLAIAALGLFSRAVAAVEPDGLYFMTRLMGSSLEMKAWYFRGGRFAQEPRSDLAKFDFAAAESSAPGSTGTLSIAGDQWTFRWMDGRVQTARHEPATPPGVCFYWNAGLFCRAKSFTSGQALDGTFSGSLGGGGVGSARTFRFFRNGRYSMAASGSVTTSGAYAGSSGGEQGRYQLSGTALTLQPDAGTPRTVVAFPFEPGADPAAPERLYVGGFMLKRTPSGDAAPVTAGPVSPPPPSAPSPLGARSSSSSEGMSACPQRLPPDVKDLTCRCSADMTRSGSVWGTDVYTADSAICRTAVHGGAIGESGGPVRVRTVAAPAQFTGSTRNGVSSNGWSAWHSAIVVESPGGKDTPRRSLGLQISTVEGTVIVRDVVAGSAAERAGVLPGDIIVSFRDRVIGIGDDLIAAVAASVPDDRSSMRVLRNGGLRTLQVDWSPAAAPAAAVFRSTASAASPSRPVAVSPAAALSFLENDPQSSAKRFTARVTGARGVLTRAELTVSNPSGKFEKYRPYSQSDVEKEPYSINTDLAAQEGSGHWHFHILRVYRDGRLISPDRSEQPDAQPMRDPIDGDVVYEIDGGSELVAGRLAKLNLYLEDGTRITATTTLTDRWE